MTTRASVLLATLAVSTRASDADDIAAAITPIVQKMATKYSCAVSVALKGDAEKPVAVKVAAGEISRGGRSLTTADPMVWGSITKMLTGTAVLRLVDEGHIGLQDPVAPVIDAFLAKMAAKDPTQGFAALSDLFGDGVKAVTVKDLLHMHSGIPDYDTASPGRHPKDTLRTDSYAHPNRSYTPAQLLTLPWVKTGRLLFKPGTCETWRYYNCYSSTNFLLLGLLLAGHAGVQSWEQYDQGRVLSAVSSDFDHLKFAVKGAPQAWTPVHGYDETHYNNQSTPHDVHAVAGVFGGWTASDLVGDAMDTAALAQDIYGKGRKLLSQRLSDMMYATSSETGYGLATFNLTRLTPNDVAFGHLGATYGYQSVVAYVPSLGIALSIGTNIESDRQSQPADIFCSVFNTAKAVVQKQPLPTCTYEPGYWSGGCKCKLE